MKMGPCINLVYSIAATHNCPNIFISNGRPLAATPTPSSSPVKAVDHVVGQYELPLSFDRLRSSAIFALEFRRAYLRPTPILATHLTPQDRTTDKMRNWKKIQKLGKKENRKIRKNEKT